MADRREPAPPRLPSGKRPESPVADRKGRSAQARPEPEKPLSAFDAGMEIRRRVLGDAHVDRAGKATTAFDADFQTLITEAAWGTVWVRPGIRPRDRSLVTLALLAGLGHWEEFAMHIRATANTGASVEEVREVILHVAIYAGAPAANTAIRIARKAYAEIGREV